MSKKKIIVFAQASVVCLLLFTIGCASTVHNAALHGNLDEMKLLVKQGADINARDRFGCTALHWAVFYQYVPVVEYLLKQGAAVDVQATEEWGGMRKGNTPLMVAAYYGFYPIVKLLLEHGANKDIKNWYGYTARMYAHEFGYESIKELLRVDAKIKR